MTAAATSEACGEYSVVLGVATLATIRRIITVDFRPGFPPNIELSRERHDGMPIASMRIYYEAFRPLAAAIAAARRGDLGVTQCGSVRFEVLDPGVLGIGILDSEGKPRGSSSIITSRSGELDRLAEAHCLASRHHEGASSS